MGWSTLIWIQGEGSRGYREKDKEDTGRRMERIQGKRKIGYREKDREDTGRRIERIQGEG